MTLTILSTFNKRTPEMSRARLTHTVQCSGCGRVYDIDAASYKKHQPKHCQGCPAQKTQLPKICANLTEQQRSLALTPGWLANAIAKFKQDGQKVAWTDNYDQPLKQVTLRVLEQPDIDWLRRQKSFSLNSTLRQVINYGLTVGVKD